MVDVGAFSGDDVLISIPLDDLDGFVSDMRLFSQPRFVPPDQRTVVASIAKPPTPHASDGRAFTDSASLRRSTTAAAACEGSKPQARFARRRHLWHDWRRSSALGGAMRLPAGSWVVLALATQAGCSCSGPAFSRDDAARICVTLQACSPREFAFIFGGSLENCASNSSPYVPLPGTLESSPPLKTGLEQPIRDVYACLLASRGDCAKANRCWSLVGEGGSCAPDALERGQCNGSVLSGCTRDGHRFAVDCARYGGVCGRISFLFASFNACGLERCGEGRNPVCRGNSAEACLGEMLALADCGRQGRRCEVPADGGSAQCVGDRPCARADLPRCEGSVAVICPADEKESRVDCAASPTRRRCESGGCANSGNECSNTAPSCEEDTLVFCQDGFLKRFSCTGEGFGRCDAGRCLPKP